MKTKSLFFITICLFTLASCKRGYKCNSGKCEMVNMKADYVTLDDCKKYCENTAASTGAVVINTTFEKYSRSYVGNSSYSCENCVEIAIGYTSNDIENKSYILKGDWCNSPAQFFKDGLTPGIYYYVARKYSHRNTSFCPVEEKKGSFTVTSGRTTTVDLSF